MDFDDVIVAKKSPNRLWTRDFVLLLLGLSCVSFTNYGATTVMAFYVAKISGSLAFSGLVGGAFSIASLVLRPVSGLAANRIGARWIMLASTLLCMAACAMHVVAGAIALLVACRVLHGAGYSFYTTAGSTAVANVVPLARRSEGMGYYMLGNVIAMAIGPAITIAIVGDRTMAEFQTCFLILAAVCLLASSMTLGLGRIGRPDGARQGTGAAPMRAKSELPPALMGFEAGALWPCCVGFLMLVSYSALALYLAPYGRHYGWENVGAFFGVYAASMSLPRVLAGRIADRHGADIVMFPSFLLAMAGYVLVAFARTPWMLYAAGVPLGIAMGTAMPQITTLCISRCSRERRGTAAAAYYVALDSALAFGMILAGRIVAAFGYRAAYLLCAGSVVGALLLYTFTLSGRRSRRSC
jgi:MFS family permease